MERVTINKNKKAAGVARGVDLSSNDTSHRKSNGKNAKYQYVRELAKNDSVSRNEGQQEIIERSGS